MKAMVLAAGLGTRLSPLTLHMPKALVPLNGAPMLDILLNRLVKSGFDRIIVNVHHFSDQIIRHLKKHSYPGIQIEVSDESDVLLDTGGALLKARWYLDGKEPFLVHNVDVISGIDLNGMMKAHHKAQALATLAVSRRESSRAFLFDEDGRLAGWENTGTHEKRMVSGARAATSRMAFSGIHVVDPEIFTLIKGTGRFSIIPTYLDLAASHKIQAFPHPQGIWFDAGKPETLRKAEAYLNSL